MGIASNARKTYFGRVAIALALGAAIGTAGGARAQSCETIRLTPAEMRKWYNPHPSPDDFSLPMLGGLELIFTPIDLASTSLYGDARSTYTMGSREKRVFETNLDVRIGSPIIDKARDVATLLVGKYELSKGQYAGIMGDGSVNKGVAEFYRRTKDTRVRKILEEFVKEGGSCYQRMTREIINLLAEPVAFLSYRDYVDAIDTFNLYCARRQNCREKLAGLGNNPAYPAFIRLPSEHEWEFVARGGRDYAKGHLPKAAMQADLPMIDQNRSIRDFAHIDKDPPYPLPIGSREPLFGLYDMLGNVEELMQNPFTAENGFGAVGAYVARGGFFGLRKDELRVSLRRELPAIFRDDTTGEFESQFFPYTGMRLVVGLPIAGISSRAGSTDVRDTFETEYVPVSEAGDIAGSSVADAKDVGRLRDKPSGVSDEVSADDRSDYFIVTLDEYGAIKLDIKVAEALEVTVATEADATVKAWQATARRPEVNSFSTPELLPGRYLIKLVATSASKIDNKYDLSAQKVPAADTGIPRPETASLGNATEIRTGTSLKQVGYVGPGDLIDTYPIKMAEDYGGIVIKATSLKGAVRLNLLDERQNVLATKRSSDADESLDLAGPFEMGQRGYVQVASEGGPTTYQVEITSKRLFDSVFSQRPASGTTSAKEGSTYEVYLSKQTRKLYMPVPLRAAAKLRVEMTKLSADVDMEVLDTKGNRIKSDHRRDGTQPEFFEAGLESGNYNIVFSLRDGIEAASFNTAFFLGEFQAKEKEWDPAMARRDAQFIGLFNYNRTHAPFMNVKDRATYLKFTSERNAMVTISIAGFDAAADLDIFLERFSGDVLGKSVNSGAQVEEITATVTADDYYIRVERRGSQSPAYFGLNLSYLAEMEAPNLYFTYGNLIETHGDWEIFRLNNKCYMVNRPKSVSPNIGWRQMSPYFMIGVGKGNDAVWNAMDRSGNDDGTDIYRAGTVKAEVEIGGKRSSIPALFDDKELQPLSKCDKKMCFDQGAIQAFMRGSKLTITGRAAKTNAEVTIEYGLKGYTKAAQRINEICEGKAPWIYGR